MSVHAPRGRRSTRLPLLLLLSLSGGSAAGVRSVVAVADTSGACVMLGYHATGAFTPAQELSAPTEDPYRLAAGSILRTLRVGDTLAGIDNTGRQTRVVIDGINPQPDLGESSLHLGTAGWRDGTVAILSKPQLPIRLLHPRRIRLPENIDTQLRAQIDALYQKHLPEKPPDERPTAFGIREPIAEALADAPDLAIVKYPLVLTNREGDQDDRAQAFFLVSIPEKRVIRGEFGHGEWASGSSVLTIWPEIYFRVAGANRIYFVGRNEGGWEDPNGRALYDLRTGREILLCY